MHGHSAVTLAASDEMTGGTALLMALALGVGGLLVIGTGLLPQRGLLGKNAFLGLRTRRSMASDENWETVHRVAAPWLVAGGLLTTGAGVSAFFVSTESQHSAITITAVCTMLVLLGVGSLLGHRALGPGDGPHPGVRHRAVLGYWLSTVVTTVVALTLAGITTESTPGAVALWCAIGLAVEAAVFAPQYLRARRSAD
ncbi:SdpI family protein [Streptomyces sp. XM4193]|uniref:SdpI family protein n=1 Tax=Streptomyces sp. XM4193 TaxID=2929782 RepID=UPI001FF9A83A|nr:SdpI family protein [Streptomyces sp. XM4193]MCK1794822.1 SdpI family protein [Streptomyces sp. XM4193]